LALSYNENNTIHTFDIVNNITNIKIQTKSNIKFYYDDLFNESIFEQYKDLILNSAFIFLDVDPHNGTMEYYLYNKLKNLNYQGFIICDDIWLFKDMRNNFWYKIEPMYKSDITYLGHFSGTGIINFNKNNIFPTYDNSNWTLITAYFNLGNCSDASNEIKQRDKNYYFNSALSTLCLPYNLVIYCDKESFNDIKSIRPEFLSDKTKYIIMNFDDFIINDKNYSYYRDLINLNRQNNPYQFDPRNTASYYLFCVARYLMIKNAIELNYFSNSTHFGWINFCIERMGYKNLVALDEALYVKRDNMYMQIHPDYQLKHYQHYKHY